MSVTFSIRTPHMVPFHGIELPSGSEYTCAECHGFDHDDCLNCFQGKVRPEVSLNVANVNAGDLLRFLGIACANEGDLYGEIRSRDLSALIASKAGSKDSGRLGQVTERIVDCGRPSERMAQYLATLANLCDIAGDLGIISWG